VSRALFQTPGGRRLYEARLRTLYTNVFQFPVITNRIADTLAKLRAAAFRPIVCSRSNGRRYHAHAHRASRPAHSRRTCRHPTNRSGHGRRRVGQPSGWRDEYDRGEPLLARLTENTKAVLHIQARGGRCRASWRTMIFLNPGRYRFEGQVRATGLSNGYTGLRISGDQRNARYSGSFPWQALQHEFVVTEDTGDVELVCEFYGRKAKCGSTSPRSGCESYDEP